MSNPVNLLGVTDLRQARAGPDSVGGRAAAAAAEGVLPSVRTFSYGDAVHSPCLEWMRQLLDDGAVTDLQMAKRCLLVPPCASLCLLVFLQAQSI